MDDFEIYYPPARSRATRPFPARSRSSARGFLFWSSPAQGRIIQLTYASDCERKGLLVYAARPDVVDIWDQPPAISYTDSSGKTCKHTPDFLVTFQNNLRMAVAVKPQAAVVRLGFEAELCRVRHAMSPSYANELRLFTDIDMNDADVRNAELLHIARQEVDSEAREIIATILEDLGSARSVTEIIAESGLAARGWAALLCAIFDGEASIASGRKFTGRSLVHPRGEI